MQTRIVFLLLALFTGSAIADGPVTEVQYLSGTGSDATVDWEFKVSGGRRSGEWTKIPVPANWEMVGFGTYRYYCDWQEEPAPDHTGWYRHRFNVPANWAGRKVEIVVGAAMTDAEVKINGQLAGPVHQGGFYQFRYDISTLLTYGGENLLEVTVSKFSADRSVNRAERQADYWLFGGIYRPVWLEARPSQHIVRSAIDARHTGAFAADVFLGGTRAEGRVIAQIEDLQGNAVGAAFASPVTAGAERVRVEAHLENIRAWSAEWPNRYRVRLRLETAGQLRHERVETFGFRTVELRPRDGLYVNGQKVRLKGSNRHTIWPTTGRATNRALSWQDVQLMKDMNMNAVRMSHYPPDSHFLEAADELGLYVIDELGGWQKAYATEPGRKLVQELVTRDVNHPSVIIWANGNEGGNNHALVPDYATWDPQQRLVIHPWNDFNGINTAHYEMYDGATGWQFHGREVFLPTEFLHGNFDGGHAAGLDDWWNLMLRNPLAAGGFLWAFADEGIVREDRGGAIDTENDSAPDGIVGPFREKEGSFFAIKEIWSPVFFEESELESLPPTWERRLRVHNRYEFTNLADVRFTWQLVRFPEPARIEGAAVAVEGAAPAGHVAPGDAAWLPLPLPANWREHDALYVVATDPHGREIYRWSWMISDPAALAARAVNTTAGQATAHVDGRSIVMAAAGVEVTIAADTGRLVSARSGGQEFPLSDGPRLISGAGALASLEHAADGNDYVVKARYTGELREVTWRMLPSGWVRLDYAYRLPPHSEWDTMGVSFTFPESLVTGARWLGKGPYRVWKNRLKGVEYDVWEKAYNDAMTGVRWQYPEFKGYHANLHWMNLGTEGGPITVVAATEDLYLRLFTPEQPVPPGPQPRYTRAVFPEGDLSFLHGISPIGNRFHPADVHGPAGKRNMVPRNGRVYEATLYFRFGEPKADAATAAAR
ncbi:MAG TPA: glycoside hydrolase family 2 TIM barrel-domain containing protein [Opitutus sp.]|nr:glycoside hydrolase family 2 TIM barrel-domain containing protein [Opitutus sp.]